MKIKSNVISFSIIITIFLLNGCNSNYKSITSFSERKYTPGYFWNTHSAIATTSKINITVNPKYIHTTIPHPNEIVNRINKTEEKNTVKKANKHLEVTLKKEVELDSKIRNFYKQESNTIAYVNDDKKSIDKVTDNDTPKKSVWATIAFVFAVIVALLIFLGLCLTIITGNGIVVLIMYMGFAAIPAIAGCVLAIISLLLKEDNHGLALASLVISLLPLLFILILMVMAR